MKAFEATFDNTVPLEDVRKFFLGHVLKEYLQRNPIEEDFERCTIFWHIDNPMSGGLDYSGRALGVIEEKKHPFLDRYILHFKPFEDNFTPLLHKGNI